MNSKLQLQILEVLKSSDDSYLTVDQLLKKLKIPKQKRNALKTVLRKLTDGNHIFNIGGGKYKLINRSSFEPKRKTKESNRRSAKNGNKKTASKDKLVAKVLKRGKTFFALPRDPDYPLMKVEDKTKKHLKNGNLVYVKRINSNNNGSYPTAKVVKRLGKTGQLNVEKDVLAIEYGLKNSFSKKVLEEINKIPDVQNDYQLNDRVDLQDELIFTIDGDDARDFDDAVGIKKIKSGYKLLVSIADVSHYVKYKSAVDKEAYSRATSTYLPTKVVPMLPERLSNDLCSLVPNKPRLTKTVEMIFNSDGEISSCKIYNTVIRSRYRLTYSWVSKVLKDPSSVNKKHNSLVNKLKLMEALFYKIKKLRVAKGALDFDFPEVELIRDDEGNIADIAKFDRNIAHEIIEQFMIMANSAVAEFIYKSDIPSIYRIHEQPEEKSVANLVEELNEQGVKVRLSAKVKPKDIQMIMNKVKKRDDRDNIYRTILRSLNKAIYSTNNALHFGLSLLYYTHFTSPIRRYPDLAVHRILDVILSNTKNSYQLETLSKLSEHCSIREREAEEAEREYVSLECVNFMKGRVGENFYAKIISVQPFGLFVELDDYFVEGFIPKSTYRGRGKKRRWFQMGERLEVKLVEADMEKRRLTFNLAN